MSDEATPTTAETTTVSTATGPSDAGWILRFDNRVRAFIACAMVTQFIFTVVYAQITHQSIDQNVFVVDVGLVTGAVGYYIGTSSGSTGKSVR